MSDTFNQDAFEAAFAEHFDIHAKPLEWEYFQDGFPPFWAASTAFRNSYLIEEHNVEPPGLHADVKNAWMLSFGHSVLKSYGSLAAAQAAAQADYEQRIRSALAPPPTGR